MTADIPIYPNLELKIYYATTIQGRNVGEDSGFQCKSILSNYNEIKKIKGVISLFNFKLIKEQWRSKKLIG